MELIETYIRVGLVCIFFLTTIVGGTIAFSKFHNRFLF